MPTRFSRDSQAGQTELRKARRFLLQASVAAAVVLVSIAASVAVAHRVRTIRAQQALMYGEVGRLAREAEMAALDRETAVRGYLLTRDQRSLEPAIRSRAVLAPKLDSLLQLTADAPAQHTRVVALRAALTLWDEQFATPAVAAVGALPSERSPLVALDSTLAGKTLFDPVRRQFEAFDRDQDALYANEVASFAIARVATSIAMVLELAGLITLLFLLRARLRSLISRVTAQHDELTAQNDELTEQRDLLEAQTIELEVTVQESQAAEQRLETVTDRLIEAQRIAQIGSWDLDLDSGEQYWTDEMFRLLDVSPDTGAQTLDRFMDRVHADDRAGIRQQVGFAIKSGNPFTAECRIALTDGSERTVLAHGSLSRTALGNRRLSGTIQDITEQKRAERDLRETSALLRALLDSSPLGIIATDEQLRVLSWNPAAEKLFGWSVSEVRGRGSPLEDGAFAAESRDLRDRVVREGQVLGVRTRRARKDGSVADVSLSVAVHRNVRGEVAGYVVIAADLGERLALEAQFRQAQKMEAIGRLAGGVAHDFNNLLTVISGFGDVMLGTPDRTEFDRESLGEIKAAVARAAALTRQLLAFSRQQVLQPRVLALNDSVEQTGNMLRRVLGDDIVFTTRLAADAGNVCADPGQIEQVLMNLAVNARDAMPDGGTLTVETANALLDDAFVRLHPAVERAGEYVVMSIGDTGTGMPADVRERIFEPFFTTKELGKGTGLGLSTVHGIVEQSGGHIFVYSEPGRGTTFKIYFPRYEQDEDRRPAAARPPKLPGGKETILLVEDDDAVRGVARAILAGAGYVVIEADNGRAALDALEKGGARIDLVLTDVIMPVMGGQELARHVRILRPGLQLIFMSGHTRATVSSGDISADVSFIEKPFSTSGLLRQVREMLDRRSGVVMVS